MSYRPVVRVCATAALALALGSAAAMPAAAEESASTAAAPEVLSAMARDLGLSAAEAEQRLLVEQAAAEQDQRLTAELGDSHRGSWLNEAGELVVATSDPAAADAIVAAGAQPQVVTGEDPQAAMDALNAASQPAKGVGQPSGDEATTTVPAEVGAWFVDEASGQVVVQATDLAAGEQFKARAGEQADQIRVELVAATPTPYADIVGGDAIYGGGARCSAGFSARQGSTTFVVTAGHCTNIGGNWNGANQTLLGPVAGSSFPDNDYGIIRVTNTGGWTPTSQVRGTSSVLGSTVAAVGASTCRSGSTTGYRCGTIQARNSTVNYGGGDIVYGLTQTSACAEGGDSGGSFVSGRQAQGMTSGGSGNCSSGGTTFYQPVNEALSAYGLSLVTG